MLLIEDRKWNTLTESGYGYITRFRLIVVGVFGHNRSGFHEIIVLRFDEMSIRVGLEGYHVQSAYSNNKDSLFYIKYFYWDCKKFS